VCLPVKSTFSTPGPTCTFNLRQPRTPSRTLSTQTSTFNFSFPLRTHTFLTSHAGPPPPEKALETSSDWAHSSVQHDEHRSEAIVSGKARIGGCLAAGRVRMCGREGDDMAGGRMDGAGAG